MKTPLALKVAIPTGAIIAAGLVLGLSGTATAQATTAHTSTAQTTTALTTTAHATATSYRSPQCYTSQLRGSIREDGGGAAGSDEVAIAFKNVGAHSCTLQGWPGVSFVGDGNGTRLGAAAQQNRASLHATVTIGVGKTAIAPLRVTDALNYPASTCKPVTADGFRVYPPGEKYSLFVKDSDFTACAKSKDALLTISAIRPSH